MSAYVAFSMEWFNNIVKKFSFRNYQKQFYIQVTGNLYRIAGVSFYRMSCMMKHQNKSFPILLWAVCKVFVVRTLFLVLVMHVCVKLVLRINKKNSYKKQLNKKYIK